MNKKPPVYQIKSARCKRFAIDIGEDDDAVLSSFRRKTQLFSFVDGRIINNQSGKVLSVRNDEMGRFEIVQKRKMETQEEFWIVEENNKDGCILFNTKYPDMCITVEEGVYCDDSSLVLEHYDGSANQRFWLNCKKHKN